MKKISLVILVFASFVSFAQSGYEYVIVPAKFDFFDEAHKYGVNAMTKSFFETEGFIVYYDTDELPKDLANNRCKALYADAIEQKKLFTTNIVIQIKDCQNKLLIESFSGSSREKSYDIAYKESFRNALTTLKGQLDFKNSFSQFSGNEEKTIKNIEETLAATSQKSTDEKIIALDVIASTPQKSNNSDKLFALPIDNGYKLVDNVPNTIFLILNTSEPTVFIAQKGEINGVFQQKLNGWFFDYYQDGKLISEKVSVKF